VLDGRGTDAPVHGGALRRGECRGQLADRLRWDTAPFRHGLRRERRDQLADALDPGDMVREPAQPDPADHEQLVHHAEQQIHVGTRPDRHVPVGRPRGPAASRIDDHELPAPGLQRLESPGHVRHRPEAPVRRVRVGAEDEQEVGPVDVRYRHRQRPAEEVPAGDVLGHLVQRRGGVDVARPERLAQRARVEPARERVHHRVAQVHRDRVPPVRLDDPGEPVVYRRERLGPRGRQQVAVAPDPGLPEPVGIRVEVPERRPLRADEALAQHVGVVTPYRGDRAALDGQRQPAGRLAQRAGPVRGLGHTCMQAAAPPPGQCGNHNN
jgi:hypothetical protein